MGSKLGIYAEIKKKKTHTESLRCDTSNKQGRKHLTPSGYAPSAYAPSARGEPSQKTAVTTSSVETDMETR